MNWKPVVVGVDASRESAAAAALGYEIARAARTRCVLVHAARDAWSMFAALEVPERVGEFNVALIEQARRQVADALRGHVPAEVIADLVVRVGPTADVLNAVAAERDAELIIVGGKRHSTLGRWFGGSTSLAVARTTRVPLLVTAGEARAFRRVLAAVDLSGAARPTLEAARRFATLFAARLRAVSVVEPLPTVPEAPQPIEASEYYRLSAELLRREVWPHLGSSGAEGLVRHGVPIDTLLREVHEFGTDLLVVGSHGKRWATRLLIGSVTEGLINHLPTSMLVVPVGPVQHAWEDPLLSAADLALPSLT
ncbi:MAG TPA: universal stress protein [Gemmatimonadales bacterium]